jgi:hypothetical protein
MRAYARISLPVNKPREMASIKDILKKCQTSGVIKKNLTKNTPTPAY